MIPVGWNSQREAGNTQQNYGPVKDVMQEKETTPYELNSKREASNKQHDLGAIVQTRKR